MYITKEIWTYIKSYLFDYIKYVKYNKKKLLKELQDKTNFWTYNYKKNISGYWYYQNNLEYLHHKDSGFFNSFSNIKYICNYINKKLSQEYNDEDNISQELIKIPIFWGDENSGVHPYFLYNKNRLIKLD